jgi:hypothetical protein
MSKMARPPAAIDVAGIEAVPASTASSKDLIKIIADRARKRLDKNTLRYYIELGFQPQWRRE